MARKEIQVTIQDAGRDFGKVFKIRELPSTKAEDWAIRAFMGMARAGVEIPEGVEDAGFAGIAVVGLKTVFSMSYDDAKPLLDEMMACVSIIPDPSKPMVERALIDEDIEEVRTRLTLRKEVFDLHTNFSELVAQFQAKKQQQTGDE